ncbi:MAG: amino acid-binding protein [Nocardioides sp.]
MPYLLRVSLPDIPGSLGRLATAIGEAGGDIEAIEIVEKLYDGTAVDDVFLEMVGGAMPDAVVSACTGVEGVKVLWINRYAAGGNVFLDLEAVEDLTAHKATALDRLVDLLPVVFRSDWGARIHRTAGVRRSTEAAPDELVFVEVDEAAQIADQGQDLVVACPFGPDEIVLIGRNGGPAFLDSELARIAHLAALARSIAH